MSAPLSKDLKQKYNVRSMPIRKDDEVSIVRGDYNGNKGKVLNVYRKRWYITIEKITKTKINGIDYSLLSSVLCFNDRCPLLSPNSPI